MPLDAAHPLSDECIFQVLVKQQLISATKADEILKRRASLKEKLSEQRKKSLDPNLPSARIETPVTMIDVIDALNLKQETRPELALDEDAIYLALAEEWNIPFKKVDPVKLDLNVVTTTIPRNFALKHLVLPIAVNEGRLTVATTNPFNTEVIEDIARASKLDVSVVISTRSPMAVRRLISDNTSSTWSATGRISTSGSTRPVGRTTWSTTWPDNSSS